MRTCCSVRRAPIRQAPPSRAPNRTGPRRLGRPRPRRVRAAVRVQMPRWHLNTDTATSGRSNLARQARHSLARHSGQASLQPARPSARRRAENPRDRRGYATRFAVGIGSTLQRRAAASATRRAPMIACARVSSAAPRLASTVSSDAALAAAMRQPAAGRVPLAVGGRSDDTEYGPGEYHPERLSLTDRRGPESRWSEMSRAQDLSSARPSPRPRTSRRRCPPPTARHSA